MVYFNLRYRRGRVNRRKVKVEISILKVKIVNDSQWKQINGESAFSRPPRVAGRSRTRFQISELQV